MLPVPLSVRTIFPGNALRLERLERGRWVQSEAPFRPYIYSRYPVRSRTSEGEPEATQVERKLLSTRRPTPLYRYEFSTTLPVKELEPMEQVYRLYENHIRFPSRVGIDVPGFYRQWPCPDELRRAVVDIEGKTKHGHALNVWWAGVKDAEGEKHWWMLDSVSALKEFADLLSQHNIITGFNTTNYDWPILQRLAAGVRVPLPSMNLQYDISDSVRADQTLHGIKSRGLKSVAKWFGFSVTEIDTRNTANYTEDQLRQYNESDLDATDKLYDIYFPRILATADLTGLPVDIVIEGEKYTSTLSSIVAARGLFQKGFVSDGTNIERHPELSGFKAQGAFVSMVESKKGRHGVTGKCDVKRLYVSIILNLNLGPDTTYIARMEPMRDLQPMTFKREGPVIYYRVPDANVGAMITVAVQQDETSILREYLSGLGKIREEVKAHLKGLSEAEQERSPWHARENGLKVLGNALYGYNLQKKAYFSDLATGILITAIGRRFVQELGAHIERFFPHTIIETDTDGIYFDCVDEEHYEEVRKVTETFAEEWLERAFGLGERFTLDYQRYPASYFAAAKNYILLDSKGNIIRHGSGLKGQHRPNLEDIIIDEVAKKLLSGEVVVTQPYYDLSKYAREDFLMRRSLGMAIQDYDHETVEKQLAEQQLYRGETVEVGQIMEYYESTTGHRAYFAEDHENLPPGQVLTDLNKSYYTRRLDRIFETLGLSQMRFTTLDVAAQRAAEREVRAFMEGRFDTCPACHGLGWRYEGRGKITIVDCGCDNGKVLVVQ
jgi:DNA polymerase elongation subunit (family B)